MKRLACVILAASMLAGCSRQQEPKTTLYQDSVISVSRENGSICITETAEGKTHIITTTRTRRKKNAVVEEKTLSKSDAVQITSSFNVIRIFETESGKTVCIRLG